jgi:ABC-type transport system involved in cytochrome c biogenesis ATPase subunit
MIAPSLEARDLEVRAGSRVLVGPLSFVHQAGTVLWLTGENGAGKSSLLRATAQRTRYRGALTLTPAPDLHTLAYYEPGMHFSSGTHVHDWIGLHERWQARSHHADLVDGLLPAGVRGPLLHLSTGEAKRLALWALLRTARHFYILDEPFEHLSPAAKATLTRVLAALAAQAAVVVATNQDIPTDIPASVLELD